MARHLARAVCATVIVSALIAVAAGCASAADDGGTTKLVIYSADPAQKDVYQELVDAWGEENNAEVEIISYPSDAFVQNFTPAVNADSQIDVLLLNGQDVRTLWSSDLLAPLGDSIDTTDLVPGAVEPFNIDGEQFAVGTGAVVATAFVANQGILDEYGLEVPTKLEDIVEIGAALEGTDVSAVAVPGGAAYLWPIWHMQFIDQTSEGTPIETTFGTLSGDGEPFDSQVYVDALSAFSTLGAENVFQNGYQGVDAAGAVSLFAEEKAALLYGGTWDIAAIAEAAPDLELVPVKFPNFVPGVESNSFGGPFPAVALYSKVPEERQELATELAAFLTGPEAGQALVGASRFGLPVNTQVTVADNAPLAEQLRDEFLPVQKTFLDWYWPKEVTAVYQTQSGALLDGAITPEEFAAQVQEAFDSAIAAGYSFSAE